MGNEYMAYPSSVKSLANELKKVCDDYFNRKISNDRITEVVRWYERNQADKLFTDGNINPTVSKIIGKRRVQLLNNLFRGNH